MWFLLGILFGTAAAVALDDDEPQGLVRGAWRFKPSVAESEWNAFRWPGAGRWKGDRSNGILYHQGNVVAMLQSVQDQLGHVWYAPGPLKNQGKKQIQSIFPEGKQTTSSVWYYADSGDFEVFRFAPIEDVSKFLDEIEDRDISTSNALRWIIGLIQEQGATAWAVAPPDSSLWDAWRDRPCLAFQPPPSVSRMSFAIIGLSQEGEIINAYHMAKPRSDIGSQDGSRFSAQEVRQARLNANDREFSAMLLALYRVGLITQEEAERSYHSIDHPISVRPWGNGNVPLQAELTPVERRMLERICDRSQPVSVPRWPT